MSIYTWITLLLTGSYPDPRDCPTTFPVGKFWDEAEVSRYKNLIKNETQAALSYTPPTNNNHFLAGIEPENMRSMDFGTYDFVVVGAGTSGSTLAYKLSDNTDWKVLLIEAGGSETEFSYIPSFATYLASSDLDWGYYTEPQEHACRGRLGNRCTYPRGKVSGGSGTINYLLHVRGNKADYDSWAEAGNEGWSFDDVLTYFIELEKVKDFGDETFRGKNGPLQVEYHTPPSPLLENFLEANKILGREEVDYNGPQQIGASRSQYTHINGRRESGASFFVNRGRCRANLQVIQSALVSRILVNERKEAYGIEYIKNGVNYTIRANKEVIVSAGAVNTPQLLMLSGIGPKEELSRLGIEIIEDLPVGRNLQDHVFYFGLAFSTNFTVSNPPEEQSIMEYLAGFGPYTVTLNADGNSFIKLKSSSLPPSVPDIQLIFVPPSCISEDEAVLTKADDTLTDYFKRIPPESCIRAVPMLLHPKSRGSITLSTKSPFDFPILNTNYLQEEEDRETFYESFEAVMDIFDTEPFRRINATFIDTKIPECNQYEYRSRDYWMCNMKYSSTSGLHATSTAALGTVVDSRLKVYGIDNLRVVDSSVMPSIISGNTNVAAFMIGAKAADIIKEDYSVAGFK